MRRILALIAFLLIAQPLPAQAGDYLTVYGGAFDVLDSDSTAQFGAEYRGDYFWQWVRPMIGASIDIDGGIYGYGGLNFDWMVAQNIFVIPNFAVGLYREGDSKDLGGAVEFRSGLELAYDLEEMGRVGVAFNHISNASIYDKNPGAESLFFTYSIPLTMP